MTTPISPDSSPQTSGIDRLFANRRAGLLPLLFLCFAVYLPGVLMLPPVDRTEVVFAETTRSMLERGALFDPRYGETVHQFRPVGTYWGQAKLAWLAGADHARNISVYRLPGMLSVTLAVLALYWLAAPLIGSTAAGLAAALFAVAPLTVLVAHLAIAEGLSLLPATVAMLTLLRIYAAPRDEDTRGLGLLFWLALGLGMLINALLLPILVIVALIALRVMDRDMWWLQRLGIASGLPIAALIASPWIVVRVLQDGLPFAGMDWREVLAALGGSQDMKLRAMPGTFVLAALLGFLPGTALLAPAIAKLWSRRDGKIARFLLAWSLGYIIYLELLSSKPGTYMVQPLFPAFAIAVAMLVVSHRDGAPPPKGHAIPWPPLAALFAVVLLVAPYFAVGSERPTVWLALPIGAVAGLFAWSAGEGRAGSLYSWAASAVAALGLFAVTLLAGVFPSIDSIWPAREVQRALASCPAAEIEAVGYNEPSAKFVLNSQGTTSQRPADPNTPKILVVNSSRLGDVSAVRDTFRTPVACLEVVNTMRGCALGLVLFANPAAATGCSPPARYACPVTVTPQTKLGAPKASLKACD